MTWRRRRPNGCSEAEYRGALDEGDFWGYVLLGITPGQRPDLDEDFEPPDGWQDDVVLFDGPCPECGEHGPCGFDQEGRPMVHLTQEEDEA